MSEEKEVFTPTIDVNSTTVADMFEKVLNDKLSSGILEKAIEKSVDKMMESAVSEVFKSYGDLNKKMQKILTEAIEPNIDSISDFPQYHEMVMQRIHLAAQNFHDNRLKDCLDEEMNTIMKELEGESTLSGILKKIIEEQMSDGEPVEGRVSLHIESSSAGFLHIAFDPQSDVDVYQCKYRMQLRQLKREDGEESQEGDDKKYTPFAVYIDGNDYSRRKSIGVRLGTHYGLEKLLFNIYATKGTLTMDEGLDSEDYETYFSSYD